MKIEDKLQYDTKPIGSVEYGEVVKFDDDYYIVGEVHCNIVGSDAVMLIDLRSGKGIVVSARTEVVPVNAVVKITAKEAAI